MADLRTDAERIESYRICRERGHVPSGMELTSLPSWMVCRWCGTAYRWTEPELVEQNAPDDA